MEKVVWHPVLYFISLARISKCSHFWIEMMLMMFIYKHINTDIYIFQFLYFVFWTACLLDYGSVGWSMFFVFISPWRWWLQQFRLLRLRPGANHKTKVSGYHVISFGLCSLFLEFMLFSYFCWTSTVDMSVFCICQAITSCYCLYTLIAPITSVSQS